MRTILTLLILSFVHLGFSQERKFKRFVDELASHRPGTESNLIKDSLVNWSDYNLKWVKITASYGGSYYCCGGKIIKINSAKDTLQIKKNELIDPNPLFSEVPISRVENISNKYLIKELIYNEPKPTSAPHYTYVRYYYEIKE